MKQQEAEAALKNTPAKNQSLKRADFELTDGATNQRTKIASFKAKVPLVLREAAMRLVFVVGEEFTADGTGNTETHNLSNELIDTPNTSSLELYSDGQRVQPDSVDYDANSFDYTDSGNDETLHAFYVARDPVKVSIERVAPKSQGRMADVVYDDVSAALHERNQTKEPPRMEFGEDPLKRVVPKDWKLEVYADGPVAYRWDDSGLATNNGDVAVNAMMTIPVARSQKQIPGLSRAVRLNLAED
ncbi:hypothetical protein [Haloarchaeobius sp. DFWS5]|uniref:hypothetical protein n=1 Tax=Haloarchaeobius sp. DFWS5 TaxID=3446114 RepID=UPI003EB6F28F